MRFSPEQVTRAAIVMLCLIDLLPASGVPIVNDPNGFEDISWGAILRKRNTS